MILYIIPDSVVSYLIHAQVAPVRAVCDFYLSGYSFQG